MQAIAKIDPLNIADPLYRSGLYAEIRRPLDDWDRWEVSIDEVLRPDLIAQRYYGSVRFKSVVAVAAGLDDYRQSLAPGIAIPLPPVVWLRQRVKYWSELSDEDGAIVTRADVVTPEVLEPPAPVRTVRHTIRIDQEKPRTTRSGLPSFFRLLAKG